MADWAGLGGARRSGFRENFRPPGRLRRAGSIMPRGRSRNPGGGPNYLRSNYDARGFPPPAVSSLSEFRVCGDAARAIYKNINLDFVREPV